MGSCLSQVRRRRTVRCCMCRGQMRKMWIDYYCDSCAGKYVDLMRLQKYTPRSALRKWTQLTRDDVSL